MGPPLSGLGPGAPFRGMEPEHFSIALRSASGPLAAPIPPQQHLICPTAFDILLGWVGDEAVEGIVVQAFFHGDMGAVQDFLYSSCSAMLLRKSPGGWARRLRVRAQSTNPEAPSPRPSARGFETRLWALGPGARAQGPGPGPESRGRVSKAWC